MILVEIKHGEHTYYAAMATGSDRMSLPRWRAAARTLVKNFTGHLALEAISLRVVGPDEARKMKSLEPGAPKRDTRSIQWCFEQETEARIFAADSEDA